MTDADVGELLIRSGYWGLVSGDAAERAWQLADGPDALRALVLSPDSDPAERFLAAEVLAGHGALDDLPKTALARAYVEGLRAGATAETANAWGIPGGPMGPLGERVVALGPAAIRPLAAALDDDGPLRFVGSEEATVGNAHRWRIKDAAAVMLAALTGEGFAPDPDPATRDAAIDELRRRLPREGSARQ